jgi:hypothetical protein
MINTDTPGVQTPKKQTNLEETAVENTQQRPDESSGIYVRGHIKIFDPKSGEVFIDKSNAIHYENFSRALASSMCQQRTKLYL